MRQHEHAVCGDVLATGVASRSVLAWHHCFCRYDDGKKQFNIEVTTTELKGFHSPPDSYYIKRHSIFPGHIRSGSDLTPLKPREMVGRFFELRGRHWYDMEEAEPALRDFKLGLQLFPQSRLIRFMIDQTNLMELLHGSTSARVRQGPPPLIDEEVLLSFESFLFPLVQESSVAETSVHHQEGPALPDFQALNLLRLPKQVEAATKDHLLMSWLYGRKHR